METARRYLLRRCVGGAYFILQKIDVPEWQNNQMSTFEVDNVDVYWSEIQGKGLPLRFGSYDAPAGPDDVAGRVHDGAPLKAGRSFLRLL